jgi:hypothetical protein
VPRYKGNVTQSTLDWYAGRAQAAQQWFSNASPNYWAFTLNNNSADGTRLWIYDAEVLSGAAFPAGTGNPGGNPAPIAGYQGDAFSPANPGWALISQSNASFGSGTSVSIGAPSSIVAGNLLLLSMASMGIPAAALTPPDVTWIRLGGIDGNASTAAIATFAHIATGAEPGSYTIGTGGNTTDLSARIMQFSGVANPAVGDASRGVSSITGGTVLPAPGVFTNAPGDLVYCAWVVRDGPSNTFGYPPGFTSFSFLDPALHSMHDGYILGVPQGNNGPFVATNASTAWSALTTTIKGSNPGNPPAQALAAPIQTVANLKPGIVTLNFSPSPISVGGITRWLPPASHFEWHREAPLAVIDPKTTFNLAGIAPENAAWGSITWLAIK